MGKHFPNTTETQSPHGTGREEKSEMVPASKTQARAQCCWSHRTQAEGHFGHFNNVDPVIDRFLPKDDQASQLHFFEFGCFLKVDRNKDGRRARELRKV